MAKLVRMICPICGHLGFKHRMEMEHRFPDIRIFDMKGGGEIEIYKPDDETILEMLEIVKNKCLWTLKRIREIYERIGKEVDVNEWLMEVIE